MAELVVQVVKHGWIGGQVHQQIIKFIKAVGAEIIQLVQNVFRGHALGVSDAENTVPEQT